LQKYLQQNLQLEVEKIDGLGAGVPSDPKLAATFSENLLSTVGAYGLALQVMGQGKIASSLLPEHIRREKMWREKTKWFAVAAALFVAAAAVPYGSYYFYNWQLVQQAEAQQKIATVQNQAETLDTAWSAIEQAGGPDRQRISNMDSIVAYRNLSTDMILDIYNNLPQNDPNAPAALKGSDIAALKQILRSKRDQVFIQKIGFRYVPDLTPVLNNPASLPTYADENIAIQTDNSAGAQPGGFGPGGLPGPGGPDMGGQMGGPAPMVLGSPTGGQRGFLVTILCTTPNAAGYGLVEKGFYKKLLALKLPMMPEKPYVFKLGVIAKQVLLANDPTLMQKMVSDFQAKVSAAAAAAGGTGVPLPMGGGGGIGNGVGGAAAVNLNEAYLDPSTGEDVRNDTECTVVLLVLLDPPPAPATPAAAPAGQ
jgi:hypothetical protein